MIRSSFAPGKIILSGEYAVLFEYAGIAVPSSRGLRVVFDEDSHRKNIQIRWEGVHGESPRAYAEKIVALCQKRVECRGKLIIHGDLPLGKGMGSSTALVIAIARALLGENAREGASTIEDTLNPGNSGFDFASIWEGAPILFRKDTSPRTIHLPGELLRETLLIDTGLPSQSTTELVAWMRGREKEIRQALEVIGKCTDRLMQNESLNLVMRDHHKAQVALGVVPSIARELIAAIEQTGGSAKVVGAGSRNGGAGMVLAIGIQEKIRNIAGLRGFPTMLP